MLVSGDYCRFYRGISAYGEGRLRISDNVYYTEKDFQQNREPVSFILMDGVTEVEAGFFTMFPTLAQIIVADSVRKIGVTESDLALLRKNRVVIRGSFDGYGDRFAQKYGLPFLHRDLELARAGDYFEHGVDIITLCFAPEGRPYLNQDCRCQGSSAGNTGGGEVDVDLKRDFFKRQTADDLADLCWGSCRAKIRGSEALRTFLAKAKDRGGYQRK
jgi:hypothetical protein